MHRRDVRSSRLPLGSLIKVLRRVWQDRIRELPNLFGRAVNFHVIADISADKVNRFVAQLKDEGRSPRTIGAYLEAIKGFTRWLTRHGKLSFDPLITLSKPSTETDRRIVRRYLSHEEWRWLDAVTRQRETRFGMTGMERAMLYSLAIQTGLRSGEIRSLTRGKLHLTSNPPFVMADAGATKNKRAARQYIQPELARELQLHVGRKLKGALIFDLPHACTMPDMLREDLEAARQAWLKTNRDPQERLEADESDFLQSIDSDGGRIDFHSLRHTCATWLIHAGADVKTIQSVMRHADIKLTLDRYGHLFPGSEAEAVARLRHAFQANDAVLATGTNDSGPHTCSRIASAQGAFSNESGQEDAMKTARTGVGSDYEKTPSSRRGRGVFKDKR
jgi:integrase